MTAKTRYFFVGAMLILVVGLGIGLVAYYGGVPGGLFAAGPGPAELKYVPKDAAVVAYANVQDVMKSELRQRLVRLEGTSQKSGRDEFRDETGIDIENDIDYVVASVGAIGSQAHDANALILARGRFDSARLESLARSHGGQVEEYKGRKLFTGFGGRHREGAEHDGRMAVGFIERDLVALGHRDMLRRAIDTAGSGASVTDNPELMTLVGDMGQGSVWAVGRFDSIASHAKLPSEVAGRIPPITWFAASGRINGGVEALLKAETQSEEAANNLRDIIRGFVALAKMQAGNRPEAQALWPTVELAGTGKTVSLSFAVSSALLDAVTEAGAAARERREKKIE